jgi:predicted metal-dependent peptidase
MRAEQQTELSARGRARVAAARLRLMLERPFLGSLVAHLPIVESERCRSFATDAERIYANVAAVSDWPDENVRFSLAHLTLHCALGHLERRGGREAQRWHSACDHAVNQLLLEDGIAVPARAPIDRRLRGLSAEEIYTRLESVAAGSFEGEVFADETFEGGWSGSGMSERARPSAGPYRAEPRSQADQSENGADLEEGGARPPDGQGLGDVAWRWRERVALSAAAAQAGRGLGRVWRDLLGSMQSERLSWRSVLARFMTALGAEDFTFARPSRRESEALLPGRASPTIDLVAAIDTSGSIDGDDLASFLTELHGLKGQVRARLTVLACDQELAPGTPWRFEPHETLDLPEDLGGGGLTRFTPVFEWVNRQGYPPQALIYLTDGIGEFPAGPPAYPVLWIVKGPAQVPWGERIAFL